MEARRMSHRMTRNGPAIVEIRTDVPSPWTGWHFSDSGRHLISPDRQRITPERMAGILWRDAMELRRAGFASRRAAEKRVSQGCVKVVVVNLADWQAKHFGSRAG